MIDCRVKQNYLREQPDNLKSFNIVAETAQFVNLVYSNITPQNIDLASQLFETLNEFTVVCITARPTLYHSSLVPTSFIHSFIHFILYKQANRRNLWQDIQSL